MVSDLHKIQLKIPLYHKVLQCCNISLKLSFLLPFYLRLFLQYHLRTFEMLVKSRVGRQKRSAGSFKLRPHHCMIWMAVYCPLSIIPWGSMKLIYCVCRALISNNKILIFPRTISNIPLNILRIRILIHSSTSYTSLPERYSYLAWSRNKFTPSSYSYIN